MAGINSKKKIAKLNHFIKTSDRDVYYWMYSSRALRGDYNYLEIQADITRVIRERFDRSCNIYYLGSRVMGIADDEESDLDLFIDIGRENYFRDRNYNSDVRKIEVLEAHLNALPREWEVKKINYPVPSIKAIHKETGLKCDISVTNGMAVHNSHLIGHLFDIQPEACAFYLFIKRWLRLFDVRFKGFTLTLMVIFYLQTLKLMPRIRDVQKDVPPEFIDGYAVQFDESRTLASYDIDEMRYYKDYLRGFFYFYQRFAYEDYIISTYLGEAIKKANFEYKIDDNHPITISAPLLRRVNCAKYLSNVDVSNFINACHFSVKFIDEYRPPKSTQLFDYYRSN